MYVYDILINFSNMRHTLDLLSVFLLMSTGLSYLTSEEVVGIIFLAHDFDHASCYGDRKTLISAHLTILRYTLHGDPLPIFLLRWSRLERMVSVVRGRRLGTY